VFPNATRKNLALSISRRLGLGLFEMMGVKVVLVLLLSSTLGAKEREVWDSLPDLQELASSLPTLVNMLMSGDMLDLGEMGEEADAWFEGNAATLRRLVGTLNTLARMACKLADKAGRVLEQVEVDTSLLIFKGLFTTGEELVLTVVPMVDLLPTLLRNLVSKKTILNMLNLDSVKSEIMGMSDETARFYVKQLKAIPKKERDEGLALLKVLETMLKLVEEDADYSKFEEVLSQVLQILPGQVENVQTMLKDLSVMEKLRRKSVIFNPDQKHQEL